MHLKSEKIMKNIASFQELEKIADKENKKLYEVFQEIESFKLEKSTDQLRDLMKDHLKDMEESIKRGLESPHLSISGMSGMDSKKISDRHGKNKNTPFNKLFGKILSYSIAVSEENQRMGKIVACPTAGSCGIVPAVIIAYSEEFNLSQEKLINSLFTAGGIGKFAAQEVPLSGAMAGCQAECGVASAMAAGALVELMDGSNSMIINAAALALKNSLGLVCDPVAGLVEVPCIKRNGFYAIHAATAAEMALAGIKSVIPMDEVIESMKQIGNLMSQSLKESSEGGLAITPTACKITKNIQKLGFN